MTGALRAEWTKLHSLRSTYWLVAAVAVSTALVSAAATASVDVAACPTPTSCFEDTTRLSLTGAWVGQAAVAVLAILAIGAEYEHGSIRTTLAAMPRRHEVLAAKALVLAALAGGGAVAGVLLSLAAGRLILPGNGFSAANGYAALSLADGPTLRAAAGTVAYLVLVALLALGVGTLVRDVVGGVTLCLGALYAAPLAAQLVADPDWRERLQQAVPTAGLAIQATLEGQLPVRPWPGLAVSAAYAGGALLAAALVFARRDA